MYGHGARMRRLYRLSEVKVEIQPGDSINPELQLLNSYDTAWSFILLLGAFRIVCSNGLVVGKQFLRLKKRHVADFEKIDLQERISTALMQLTSQCDQWKRWAENQLTDQTYDKVLSAMDFSKKALVEIRRRLAQEAKGFSENGIPIMSLWIFFNVLTWYITHRTVSLNHRVEMERRLRSAIHHFN